MSNKSARCQMCGNEQLSDSNNDAPKGYPAYKICVVCGAVILLQTTSVETDCQKMLKLARIELAEYHQQAETELGTLDADIVVLKYHNDRLEATVERLIEAGDNMAVTSPTGGMARHMIVGKPSQPNIRSRNDTLE